MSSLALHEFHASLGAKFANINGMETVDHYADSSGLAEHSALRAAAGVLDLSFRGRLCLTGSDRLRFLNGQVTNNVKDLAVGEGCYAGSCWGESDAIGDADRFAVCDHDWVGGIWSEFQWNLDIDLIRADVEDGGWEASNGYACPL